MERVDLAGLSLSIRHLFDPEDLTNRLKSEKERRERKMMKTLLAGWG